MKRLAISAIMTLCECTALQPALASVSAQTSPSATVLTTVQPSLGVPRGGQAEPRSTVTFTVAEHPKGVVHFIGGALVGATPQATYSYLTERIARGGYTVVQTAYPFTFAHEALANELKTVRNCAVLRTGPQLS